MMQAMKGATMALGSMNRTMNLPSLQRIAMEFERENDIMEQRQEMMDDAIDDAMDVGLEEEGDEVVEQVLEEIGVDLSQAVGDLASSCCIHQLTMDPFTARRDAFGIANGNGAGDSDCPSDRRRRDRPWR
jgi:charged multivesicular body protein 2A